MNKLFIISLLIFIPFLPLQAEKKPSIQQDDTSTIKLNPIDVKPQIVKNLYGCFESGKFDSLEIFLDCYVELIVNTTNGIQKEIGTDYKEIENLNSLFKNIDYSVFQISSAINKLEEDVLIVKIYALSNGSSYMLEVYFVLDKNGVIYLIAVG